MSIVLSILIQLRFSESIVMNKVYVLTFGVLFHKLKIEKLWQDKVVC